MLQTAQRLRPLGSSLHGLGFRAYGDTRSQLKQKAPYASLVQHVDSVETAKPGSLNLNLGGLNV